MSFALRLAAFAAAALVSCASLAQAPGPGPVPITPAADDIKADPEKEQAGRLAAQAWLQLLDRRDWGTAWDASSALFRKNVPLARWMDAIPGVRQPMGAFVEREALETTYKTTLPGHPPGDYVTVIFASKFQNNVDLREVVTTVREQDGRWRVTGYQPR